MSFTFAIGDIHGCHTQLEQLLDTLELWWTGGKVVFLGDYVDRGPSSRPAVERIMAGPTRPGWQWVALKGNHEDVMVSALRTGKHMSMWLENGGRETLESFDEHVPAAALNWMEGLPNIHIDRNRIFAHANLDEDLPLDRQSKRTLLWSRPAEGHSGFYWGRHFCHGHTPATENPITIGNRTNIDSGCVFGGALTAAVFDDDLPGPPIRFVNIANRRVD